MANAYFQFKQFTVQQDKCSMKVTTDGCLFGAWVAERLMKHEAGDGKLLDIGTGTGLLSLMLAQKNPLLSIDAVELDKEAAQQANENVSCSPWKRNFNVIQADARKFSYSHQYNIIISNPPFYENELKGSDTKKNVAHHNEGLLLNELLTIIKNNLKADGRFFLLLPFKRDREVNDLLLEHKFDIEEVIFVRQSINHDFFRIMLSGHLNPDENTKTTFEEMSICHDKQQYTPEFIKLLRDYYLYL